MGTFTSITLEDKNKTEIQQGFNLLKKIEQALSSYQKTALLYKLNQNKKIQADEFLVEAIIQSKDFYQKSKGYFDITIGSITKELYHFGEDEKIPTRTKIEQARLNINAIQIKKNTITLEKNIVLDLGGMGKGFAVDKMAEYYREQNITYGIIALSGDIQSLHQSIIYIDSPFTQEPFIKLQTLKPNISISTSGSYRRFVGNQKNHHLINPKNKKQGKSFVSITLITQQNNALIDAMATAVGVMPFEIAMNFLKKHPNIGYILVRPKSQILYGNLKNLVDFKKL